MSLGLGDPGDVGVWGVGGVNCKGRMRVSLAANLNLGLRIQSAVITQYSIFLGIRMK